MIGSISKIRPCGHSCHYKYASCPRVDHMTVISRDYKADVDGKGIWNKNLDNITLGNSLFKSAPYIKKLDVRVPKMTNGWDFVHSNTGMSHVKIYAPNATTFTYAFTYGGKFEEIEIYCPKCTEINGLMFGAYCVTEPKIGLKAAKNAPSAFNTHGTRMYKFGSNLENVQNADNLFYYQSDITELKYPIDENGECIYDSRLPQQFIEGVGQYKYLHFPNLNTGKDAFHMMRLDKSTTLSILNSLPTYTSGSHPITIGIHKDHQYDPDVNVALKRCQNSYITPIEEYGATLPETITTDKGWTLTVQWNGTKTSNAYPEPEL